LSTPGVIEVDRLKLESPTLQRLKESGIRLSVPLISQGELIGLLNLGPRMSEADYSTDDRRLLNTLATQAAPALRVAQLARQQQIEALERERMEHELRVARVIQQTLLPKDVPHIMGYTMSAHWQPARAVSGDFYDFINFPDGKIAIVVADVTDKGVPAALVMATTRSILRSTAEQLVTPGAVLERANEMLCPDMPPNMFVTCLYALLDPKSGTVRYANAGHNVPFQRHEQDVQDMFARGMPLGLMPGMSYEEKENHLEAGDMMVLYSDGITEAHNPQGDMFGTPRLRNLLVMPQCGSEVIQCVLNELTAFTGAGWEQEDDVTFVTIDRQLTQPANAAELRDVISFTIPSKPGNERQAMEQVAAAIADLDLPTPRLERLKTAVAEATMNAMEHGNHYQPDKPVDIEVDASDEKLVVRIRDHGGGKEIPISETPDIDAKLSGLQSPRGWGLFLIKNMVDEVHVTSDEQYHTIEMVMQLKGEA
jgi:serine phosphatase RsbU (regulator of sigma subunit)/anti-sigma regulatory factor (Ser/Thr protein kinase)